MRCVQALAFGYRVAATLAFLVAVTNNFLWHRHWTFARATAGAGIRPRASCVVSSSRSSSASGCSTAARRGARTSGRSRAQAIAIVARHAAELPREQALELSALSRAAAVVPPAPPRAPAAAPPAARPRRPTAPPDAAAPTAGLTAIRGEGRARSRRPEDRRGCASTPERRSRAAQGRRAGRSTSFTGPARRSQGDRRRSTSTPRPARVTEAWTGFQVAWTMARGYPGAFGRSVNSPWIWVTLCVLFVAAVRRLAPAAAAAAPRPAGARRGSALARLLQRREPRSVGPARLPAARLSAGAPAVDRPAARGAAGRAAAPARPVAWLAIARALPVGFRIGLNVTDGNVIDVGYSGVIGADKLAHGGELYGAFPTDNAHGDTYGPLLYWPTCRSSSSAVARAAGTTCRPRTPRRLLRPAVRACCCS